MKKLFKYLGFTFGVAYLIQILCGIISINANNGKWLALAGVANLIMSGMMFVPLIGVLVSGEKLKDMGWKPRFKGNIGVLLFSWFAPAVMTLIGAVIYFLIFPSHFDITGKYLVEIGQGTALEQLEALGVSYTTQIIASSIGCITYAPIINMIFAVGEEAGWRGYMYPVLKERFGKLNGIVLGGIIWGMWHWPIMMLTGYEYGTEYRGFPTLGMVVFCIFTIFFGALCDYVYEKSQCIWLPAILHGAINAAATVPIVMAAPSVIAATRLLGPAPNGLLAGLPIIVAGAIVLFKAKKENPS